MSEQLINVKAAMRDLCTVIPFSGIYFNELRLSYQNGPFEIILLVEDVKSGPFGRVTLGQYAQSLRGILPSRNEIQIPIRALVGPSKNGSNVAVASPSERC